MKNEFDAALDRNGYAPSIMQKGRGSLLGGISGPDRCYCCGRGEGRGFLERLERHEPWNAANRTKSKNLGLWVTICRGCHEEAHRNRGAAEELRRDAQRAAMLRYGWSREEFIRRFGKSELSEDEAAHIIPKEAGRDYIPPKTPTGAQQSGSGRERRKEHADMELSAEPEAEWSMLLLTTPELPY